jgi:16S rRNA (cytosine1402-N4)-methyltransferase
MRREAQPDPAWAHLPVAPPFTPRLRLVGRKHRAADAELAVNPRARSAILRVAERLPVDGAGSPA